jgi:hypothetical protein
MLGSGPRVVKSRWRISRGTVPLRSETEYAEAESKEKHGVFDPYAGVDYNLTLCPLQSRLQHIYHGHGQLYARVDLSPIPESTLSPQSGTFVLVSGFPVIFNFNYLINHLTDGAAMHFRRPTS